ncbi:hypothetical protein D6D23_01182 [Aureobasidium pullulans]|nr:hypothetical protein D6D27_07212 [Aureobasidium pullulans]THW29341.1 hypothetical protein D6D23_01182 [Aureobasidium pullulans]
MSTAPSLKAELLTYMTSPAGTPTNSIFSSHKPNLPKQSINMLRTITRNTFTKTFKPSSASALRTRGMADKKVEDAAQAAGEAKDTNPQNPSVISSAGAIGKQFNPDGNIGQVGEKIGGAFSKDGAIGSQFDASKDGIAGQVEKAVDGPSRPATQKK